MKARPAENERERLAALGRYGILDTAAEAEFDEVVELAAALLDMPVGLISLVDEDRQWFKARRGIEASQTPLEQSVCAHAILQPEVFEIADLRADRRTADNPLVTDAPHFRYYAGAPIVTPEGLALGTLCVLDYRPRRLDDLRKRTLAVLARQVMARLDLRRALEHQALMIREIDHRVKNSMELVSSLLNMQARRARTPELRAEVEAARNRVMAIAKLHEQLHVASNLDAVDFSAFLDRLVSELRSTAADRIALQVELAPAVIDARRASMLGVLVNEMVTNALRHAFPDGRQGVVLVRLAETAAESGSYRLEVEDDGVGIQEPSEGSSGLGTMLMDRLADQLGATVTRQRLERGTRLTLLLDDQP